MKRKFDFYDELRQLYHDSDVSRIEYEGSPAYQSYIAEAGGLWEALDRVRQDIEARRLLDIAARGLFKPKNWRLFGRKRP
jgi:hypothetical protein